MRLAGIVSTLLLIVLAPSAYAGGPIVYADDGTIVKWPSGGSGVEMTLDQGALGVLTNAQADALVTNIVGVWNGVAACTVNLTIAAAELSQDIDHTNYTTVIGAFLDGINPVVYDVDGLIVDDIHGAGARNQILGFAGPLYSADYTPPDILEAYVVLNGRMLDGIDLGSNNPEFTETEYEGVIVHEVGHLLGLDHSQINAFDVTNDDQPTMFPYYQGGTAIRSLAPDDIGWISYIYPSMQYDVSFGSISGRVLERVGASNVGYQGINVIARRIGGGRIDAGSCVSGYIYREGPGPASLAGTYVIPGVPPGSYTVEVEEILDVFTGGSGVGPLDPPANFPAGAGNEFYNGASESSYDNPSDQTPVVVTAGNETANIDIILNTEEAPNRASRWHLLD